MYPVVRLYPGELMQGALGRLQASYGIGFRQFNVELLGIGGKSKRIRSALDFKHVPIWRKFWPGLRTVDLLRQHTLAPLFIWRTTFKHQVPKAVVAGPGHSWQVRLPRGMNTAVYKFCPLCWSEELRIYGERHWTTLFQVPGVNICPRHGVPLHETLLRLDASNIPPEYGYITPAHVLESRPLKVDPHSLLIAKTAYDLLQRAPGNPITVAQWLQYLCWLLIKSEEVDMVEQYQLLQSAKMYQLIRKTWGNEYGETIGWNYPLANLKDYRWWGWMKLLLVISPQKKLVNALRECLWLNAKKSETKN